MAKMHGRLQSTRKRALVDRQFEMLTILLDKEEPIDYRDLYKLLQRDYEKLREPMRAFIRDLNGLSGMRATLVYKEGEKELAKYWVQVRPEWATEITDTEFYKQINSLPAAKTRLMVTRR